MTRFDGHVYCSNCGFCFTCAKGGTALEQLHECKLPEVDP